MSYLDELKDEALNLHTGVVEIIKSTGIVPIPIEIINNSVNAIIKLVNTDNIEKAKNLLSIIICYREHIVYNDSIFFIIKSTMIQYPSLAQSIAKSAIKNTPNEDFSKLYELFLKFKKDKGARYILRKYFNKDIIKSNNIIEDNNIFFENILNSKENTNISNMILKYLKKVENISDSHILEIIKKIKKSEKENIEILSYLYKFHYNNKINFKIEDNNSTIINSKLIELTEDEIFLMNHSENQIEKFISTFSYLLYPHFVSLIYSINLIYLNEGKMINLLRKIIRYIGINNFIEIVKPLNIQKHFILFKDIKNIDLSVFMLLYNDSNENLLYLVDGLIGFCTLCTDYNQNIDKLLEILKNIFSINYKKGCLSLEKLISSHLFNLRNECVLNNPIPKEDSLRILEAIKISKIHENVFDLFVEHGDNDLSELIKLLIEICEIDLTNQLYDSIMGNNKSLNLSMIITLKFMIYFVNKLEPTFELIHKLIEICMDGSINEQKAAYDLLSAIKKINNNWCICELLFNDRILCGGASKSKNRLTLLYTILKNRCNNCQCINLIENFFNELVKLSIIGNIKSRKIAKEIILELYENEKLQKFILERSGVFSESFDLLRGCLNAGYLILESMGNRYKFIEKTLSEKNNQFILELANCVFTIAMYHEKIINDVLKIFNQMYSLDCCSSIHNKISNIIVNYIKNFKKHNREIRECLISAKINKIALNKDMKIFLCNKKKGIKSKVIQVIKNKK